jgi:hypothetical protein
MVCSDLPSDSLKNLALGLQRFQLLGKLCSFGIQSNKRSFMIRQTGLQGLMIDRWGGCRVVVHVSEEVFSSDEVAWAIPSNAERIGASHAFRGPS